MPSIDRPLRRGILLGAPIGYLAGAALYSSIGYLVAGTPGLLVGLALATLFAAIGLRLCLRFARAWEG
jgi:hypothetical protein